MSSLIAIVGPTGSGKSDLALRVSEEYAGEIVNCDSMQIYRGFDTGTAKLPVAERRGIPHHLIDIVDAKEIFTAGEFARRAREILSEIVARGRMPIVTGGTGFYLRALLEGLTPGPGRDAAVRARLAAREDRAPGSLHRALRRLDPAIAAGIHPHDVPKTMRALEIRMLSGAPASRLFAAGKDRLEGFEILKIGLFPPRAALYRRLDERCEKMFEAGLLEEVAALLERYPADAKPFHSIGYRQAAQAVRGELGIADAIERTKQATRNYAKRQVTWFRREPDLHRLEAFGDDESVATEVFGLIRARFPTRLLTRLLN